MSRSPRTRTPDSTLAFALDGYEFISKRCRRHGSTVFETRLLGAPTICMLGEDAARVFYDTTRFKRAGALPARVQKTLTGLGAVQGLDDEPHLTRKLMLMSLMTPESVGRLTDLAATAWQERIGAWEQAGKVVLYDEVAQLLCRAVCAWTGTPLPEQEVPRRTGQLMAMFNAPVAVGPAHWRGRVDRRGGEVWAAGLVERVRAGTLEMPEDSPLHVVAWHRDPDGRLLPARTAAVELLNLLRPTVAVNHFVVFAALALHDHPEWREKLQAGDDGDTERFVQEVRRFYPFFPVAAARVRQAFEWNGIRFPAGRRVLLDLYGTNHDPQLWEKPDRFDPERFRGWDGSPFDFIPQGGGDHVGNHRCAGEWATIGLMKTAVTALTRWMTYTVPRQNLRMRYSRMPVRPASGLVVTGVRRTGRPGT